MSNEINFVSGWEADEMLVEMNGKFYGTLKFDKEQNAFVFWDADEQDGVTYFDSLSETMDLIADELM